MPLIYQILKRQKRRRAAPRYRRSTRKSYRGSRGLSGVLKSLGKSIRRSSYPAEYAQNKRRTRQIRRQSMKLLRSGDPLAAQLISRAQSVVDDPANAYNPTDPRRVFGRGGYWGKMFGNWLGGLTGNSTIKSLASSAFDSAGDFIADSIPGGNLIAGGAEQLHKSISGRGDYSMSSSMSQSVPNFGGGEVDHVRIRSREYLGPISGSSDFKLVGRLLLNPGNHAAFPQLAKMAAHYQQYIMRGCVFYYKSTSSLATNTADPALGQVILAMNYDASEPSYASKAEMLQSQYCSSGAPAQDVVHGVECAAFSNGSEVKRIRHGDPSENFADPLNTDVGTFQIAVEGTNPLATRIGELWVTYDVMLIKGKDSKGSEIPLTDVTCTSFSSDVQFDYLVQPSFKVNTLAMEVESSSVLSFPRFIDDGQYLMTIYQAANLSSTSLFIKSLCNLDRYHLAFPQITGIGCTVRCSNNTVGSSCSIGSLEVGDSVWLAPKPSATFIVDVRTNISNPVAKLVFSSNIYSPPSSPIVFPVDSVGPALTNGQTRIVIHRVPDLLSP